MSPSKLVIQYYNFQWENSQIRYGFLRTIILLISFSKLIIEIKDFEKWLSVLSIFKKTFDDLGEAKRVKMAKPIIKLEDKLGGGIPIPFFYFQTTFVLKKSGVLVLFPLVRSLGVSIFNPLIFSNDNKQYLDFYRKGHYVFTINNEMIKEDLEKYYVSYPAFENEILLTVYNNNLQSPSFKA